MAAPCLTPVDVCALRITALDDNGTPLVGASSAVVRSLVQIQRSTTVSTGSSFEQRNGCGDICASKIGVDSITGVALELQLCQYDFALAALLLGVDPILGNVFSASQPIGIDLPSSTAATPNGVCVEAWSKAMDGSEQAASALSNLVWIHWVWPKVTWVPGNTTIAEGVILTTFTGKGVENSQIFDGPFDDFPAQPQGAEMQFYDENIPDVTCAYATVVAS
jgi:hypothetical protein